METEPYDTRQTPPESSSSESSRWPRRCARGGLAWVSHGCICGSTAGGRRFDPGTGPRRFSIAKVAAKCDPLLVRTAANWGENCGYVHSQALFGAAEKEQASEIPGSPMAALFRGRLGGRIAPVECSRRGQPSFTRRALAVTGGSALAEEPDVTPAPPGLCPSGRTGDCRPGLLSPDGAVALGVAPAQCAVRRDVTGEGLGASPEQGQGSLGP